MADDLICDVRKAFSSGFEIQADLRIPLADSPVTVLFGPSGAGKTTLLRLLAGIESPDRGVIRFREETWFDSGRGINLPPQRRRAGLLFQDYALFPHLTVARNIEFPLRHLPKSARREKSSLLLKQFDLADLAHHLPRTISGGQQQRTALARALAADPAILLLDEPLSALDLATRARTRHELRQRLVDARFPCVLVTHDRTEAMMLGDWMAVIVSGRIRQTGPIESVFRHPADVQVAESIGMENVLPAAIVARDSGLLDLQVGSVRLHSVDTGDVAGPQVFACIHAGDVALTQDSVQISSARNRLSGRVQSVTKEGPLARVELDCGFPLVSLITAQSAEDLQLQPGNAICAVVKATSVHVIPR
ncbi:MAG TPA: ABC transporter ATP-binding protein [Bryobacteraceae bacterium]|nr:ABC transporter ATP-binding protein [Bryobacteraceae bacterium]